MALTSGRLGRPETARVVLVGAGFAGLAAACALEASGVRVTLLEQKTAVGGRLRVAEHPERDVHPGVSTLPRRTPALDILLRDEELRRTLELFPIEHVTVHLPRREVHVDLRRAGRLGSLPGLTLRESLRARRVRRLLEWFGPRLDAAEPERVGALDDRSVSEFCALYLGRRLLEQVYAPLLEAHFGYDAEETSRVALLLLLARSGGPDVQLALGLPVLAERLAARLREVRLGERVVAVKPDGGGVELERGERLPADAVVVAVGPSRVPKLLTGLSPREELFFDASGYTACDVVAIEANDSGAGGASVHWVPRSSGGPLAAVLQLPRGPDAETRTFLVGRPDPDGTEPERRLRDLLAAAARVDRALGAASGAGRLVRLQRVAPRFEVGRYQALGRFRQAWDRAAFRRRTVLCGGYLVGPHAEAEVASGLRAARETLEILRGAPPA